MSATPIVGVRVHLADRAPVVLHEAARNYRAHADSGNLDIYSDDGTRIATHASMDWAWAELVYAEPAAENIANPEAVDNAKVNSITFESAPIDADSLRLYYGVDAPPEPPLGERIERAERALSEKKREQSRSAVEVARAEARLAELRIEQADEETAA